MTEPRRVASNRASSLGHRVAIGAGWMVGLRWTDRLIGLVSIAVLARILLPEDFGIVGYAMVIIGMLELFSDLATDAALIREQDADHAYYDAAWTMNMLRGLALAAMMLALARPGAAFFRESRLEAIMFALATVPLLQGLENVGTVNFRKHLEFGREFRFLLLPRIFAVAATIALALALRTYWALVAGTIARAGLRAALSYWLHPFRARLNFARIPKIFRFSRWMMLQNLAVGLNQQLPALVVGREWSSSALAFFNIGKEIADLSTTEIRAPIRRVLYPGLAQIADRPERLNEVLVESAGMLALLTVPIPLGIALVAEDVVPLFLGPQWQPTVGVLQPLCVAASVSALASNSPLAYMALNRSYLTAGAALCRLLLLVPLLIVFAPSYGVQGVAYAVTGVSCFMLAADYALTARILKINAARFLAVVWRPVTAALTMCVAVWLVRGEFARAADLADHVLSLIRSVLLGVVVYVGGVLALWNITGRRGGAESRLVALMSHYRDRW